MSTVSGQRTERAGTSADTEVDGEPARDEADIGAGASGAEDRDGAGCQGEPPHAFSPTSST